MQREADQVERNRALVKKVFEALGNGELEAVHEVLHPRLHEGAERSTALGRSVFPDLTVTLDDLIAEADKVVVRWTARGTHKGAATDRRLGRVRQTGRRLEVMGITILQIRDGKVVDTWGVTDEMGGADQLRLLRRAVS